MGLFDSGGDVVISSVDFGREAIALLFDAANAKGDVLVGALANAPNADVADLAVDGDAMYDENDPLAVVPTAGGDDGLKTDPETRTGG